MENVDPAAQEAPEPALHRAASLGDIALLERLLAEGADLEEGDDYGTTALMVAAGSTYAETVTAIEWLLAHGADPRTRGGWDGATAAWYAAEAGSDVEGIHLPDVAERLRILLDTGLDPNECASNGASLLAVACRTGDPARVRLLLDRGASLTNDPASGERWSFQIPLFAASESGSAECVQLLLDAGADAKDVCQERSQTDFTLFERLPGVDAQALNTVEAYVSQMRADSRERFGEGGETALAFAVSPEVARLLIAAGARVDAHDWYEDVLGKVLETADTEQAMGNPDAFAVADVLLEAGAALDRNFKGEFRLDSAAFRQHANVVDYLLQQSASRESSHMGSPLHSICWQGEYQDEETSTACAQIIRSLVGAGFSMDARDSEGRAPLHKAVGGDWGNPTAVRTLLELGAEPDPVDGYGQTPLHLAGLNRTGALHRALECAVALMKGGANPRLQDPKENTAIDYAEATVAEQARYADLSIAQALLNALQAAR